MSATNDRNSAVQREIEALEQREANAMLRSDASTLETLWANDMIVNSTANLIAGKQILLEMIKNGRLKLRTYERRPVRIAMFGELVVSTGNEICTADEMIREPGAGRCRVRVFCRGAGLVPPRERRVDRDPRDHRRSRRLLDPI